MLNGKFYSGLPPNMIDRRNVVSQNRQESHFFWPDDTKVDSATETRVKRRTSFQLEASDKPYLQKQTSLAENDVDTKQRFRKEFTKSSIQFDDGSAAFEINTPRKPLLRSMKTIRNDITPKPTAMKLQLPENVVNEAYTSARKKQAFTSKIQFYDYVEEGAPGKRNNARTPIMDKNDKKEVERNSKNSPKLQVKHNVRNMSLESTKINEIRPEREDYMPDRDFEDVPERRRASSPQRIIRNHVYEENLRRSASPAPRKLLAERQDNRRKVEYVEEVEVPVYAGERYDYDDNMESRGAPKKILKHIGNSAPNAYHDGDDYHHAEDYEPHLEADMRRLRVRTSPKKHVTYSDEQAEEELSPRYYRDSLELDEPPVPTSRRSTATTSSHAHGGYNTRAKSPNTRTGSSQQRKPHQSSRANMPDVVDVNAEAYHHFIEVDGAIVAPAASTKPLNNNTNRKLNNDIAITTTTAASRKIAPKAGDRIGSGKTSAATAAADAQKHLRSNLCFHAGEIVANNVRAAGTPTSQARRNARSSASSQRVSVGLPD